MGTSVELTSSFTAHNFLKLIYASFGSTSLVIAAVALIGLIAYMSSLPVNKTFTSRDSRLTGLELLNLFMYFASAPILAWMFFLRFTQFFIFLGFYFAPLGLMILNIRWLNSKWNYCDLVEYRRPKKLKDSFENLDTKKHIGTPLLIIVFIAELGLLYILNLTFALVGWILLVYVFLMNLLYIATSFGIGKSFTDAPFLKFTLEDHSSFNGFLLTKDTDHYYILTNQWVKVIFTRRFLEIETVSIPDADVECCRKIMEKGDSSSQPESPQEQKDTNVSGKYNG